MLNGLSGLIPVWHVDSVGSVIGIPFVSDPMTGSAEVSTWGFGAGAWGISDDVDGPPAVTELD